MVKASTRLRNYINLCLRKEATPFLCWIDNKNFDGYNEHGRFEIVRPKVLPIGAQYKKMLELLRPTKMERDEWVSIWESDGLVDHTSWWFQYNEHRLMAAALLYNLLKEKGL